MGCLTKVVMLMLMVATAASWVAEGQNIPSCAAKLVGCTAYLNSTTRPPSTCCDPLKEEVTNELPCLCSLYNAPGLLASLGINVTQAMALPATCGMTTGVSSCTATPAPSSAMPPSGTPKSDAGKTAFAGVLDSFLLICVAMILL